MVNRTLNKTKTKSKKEARLWHIELTHEEYSKNIIIQMINSEECLIPVLKKVKSIEDFSKKFHPLVNFIFNEAKKNIFSIEPIKLLSMFPEKEYPEINNFILSALGQGVNVDKTLIMIDELMNISVRKKLIQLLNNFLDETIYEDKNITENSFDYVYKLEKQLDDLVQYEFDEKSYLKLSDLGNIFINKLKHNQFSQDIIPVGFKQLDDILNISKGDLVIIAGRPSMGKSAFAINIALNIAKHFKDKQFKEKINSSENDLLLKQDEIKKVLFVSLEMTNSQIYERIYIATHHVTIKDIKTQSNLNIDRLIDGIDCINKEYDNIIINDNTPSDFFKTLTKIQYLIHRENISLVIIDYLQLLSIKGIENRQQVVTQMSKDIKLFAKSADIPVILLSQLSRNVERRENKRPIMSDLRESGSIEQDADIIMFLYRESYYLNYETSAEDTEQFVKKRTNKKNIVSYDTEIIIAKNRNGDTGRCFLKFWPNYSYFWDMSEQTTKKNAEEESSR